MRNHPFWSISLYKITALYVVIINFLESSGIRGNLFVKMNWHTQDQWHVIHVYLVLLFLLVWGIIYLVEVSFGLTMGAFTLRSRAGVAKWMDIIILLAIPLVAYGAWITPSTAPNFSDFESYRFISDGEHMYSPFLIWLLVFAGFSALQSLGPYGEYRFDRSQNSVSANTNSANRSILKSPSKSRSNLINNKATVLEKEKSRSDILPEESTASQAANNFTKSSSAERTTASKKESSTVAYTAQPTQRTYVRPTPSDPYGYLGSPEAIRFFRPELAARMTAAEKSNQEGQADITASSPTTVEDLDEPVTDTAGTSSAPEGNPVSPGSKKEEEDGFVIV
ncbi:MAG: hypothetical protein RLY87_1122 [Chloroflexota bacterium]|jgi:hypothetical protein